jgi:hypothetical protein
VSVLPRASPYRDVAVRWCVVFVVLALWRGGMAGGAMSNEQESTTERHWHDAFLASLRLTGNVSEAARAAEIDRALTYRAREADKAFASAWDDALDEAADALEAEARRRAVDGTEEAVYHQGVVCGTIRKYSDSLLTLLLKAHKPAKYRENHKIEHAGADGDAIVVRFEESLGKVYPDDPD